MLTYSKFVTTTANACAAPTDRIETHNTFSSSFIVRKRDSKAKSTMNDIITPPKEMLFAIDKDPYEQNNLADNPEYQKELSQMRAQLAVWMKQQGDDGH